MTKTVSSRIDNIVHKDLMERCNKIGCNINEFVGESVKFMLYDKSDFTFDPDEESPKNEPKLEVIDVPEPQVIRIE